MRRSLYVCVAAQATVFVSSSAQQLLDAYIPISYPGLSESCQDALNTSVSCPYFLSPLSVNGAILDANQTEALCVDSCYSSLQDARNTIATACSAATDNITYENVAYPATFIADNYLFAYSISCTVDSNGDFCDPQILSWRTDGGLNSTVSCSDCWLKTQHAALNDPLGYDEAAASIYSSLTSSCNATSGYDVASPTAYALNLTATTVPASVTASNPPECTGSYTILSTDTCNSLALSLGVSTYNLLHYNNLDLYCQNFANARGKIVCKPPQCDLYTWQAQDTCAGVVSNFTGLTMPQFLAWNPNFNDLCQNALSFVGYEICLSNPGGTINGTTTADPTITNGAAVAQPAPTNAFNTSNKACGSWYTIQSGDTCGVVSVANSISLTDFYFLNPEINEDCTNLVLGVAYCIEPVGSISTYSGYTYTSTGSITVAPATFASVNTAIATATNNPGYVYTPSLLPLASGTLEDCDSYMNYDDTRDVNACSDVASNYLVSPEQLLEWNPSLDTNITECSLQPGYSYCVKRSDTIVTTINNCLTINGTVEGTISTCDCYTIILGYNAGDYVCSDLVSDNSVTLDDLTTWNPWLGSDCDTGLYADLAENDERAVCIGVNATAPQGTAVPASTTASQTVTITAASMGPTATGTVEGCLKFYTVRSGDTCYNVETTYGITFEQFYEWNLSLGSDCEYLQIGLAYCVEGPASATTSATAPTQTGIVSDCTEYYTVNSGDSCAKIETLFDITFENLYEWNPAIGSNCENLWARYAVCVSVAS